MDVFQEEKLLYHNDTVGEGAEAALDPPSKQRYTVEEDMEDSQASAKKSKKSKVLYYLETKYDVVQDVCKSFEGWKECSSLDDEFDFIWTDVAMVAERFSKLKSYQRYNHFVGMSAVSRKNNLGRNLLRMKKHFPKEYSFFPDTWILPTDLADFKAQFTGKKNKTFIIKPDNGCQGRGIFLTRDFDKVNVDFTQGLVAQRYVHKPFLLDGYKFDMRIYVLVTGCDPIRIFIHEDGLVRLCTTHYVPPTGKNLQRPTMHLTNYAVNCRSPDFEENTNPDDIHNGHKRSLKALHKYLEDEGLNAKALKEKIDDMIIKTLIAVQPSVAHIHTSCQPDDIDNSMCFEILGLDVLLDHKLNPWLLEVNHAPSFGTDSDLDRQVKFRVISDSIRLAKISGDARKKYKLASKKLFEARALGHLKAQKKHTSRDRGVRAKLLEEAAIARSEWEDTSADLGGFQKLYPTTKTESEYLQYHDKAIEIWEMLTGGQSRKPTRVTLKPPETAPEVVPPATPLVLRKKKPLTTPQQPRLSKSRSSLSTSSGISGTPSATAPPTAPSSDEGNSLSKQNLNGNHTSDAVDARRAKRTKHVKVGDHIRVQTNIGWERVLILKKDVAGRLDIRFEDGEEMHSVIPRILRNNAELQQHQQQQLLAMKPLASQVVVAHQLNLMSAPSASSPKNTQTPPQIFSSLVNLRPAIKPFRA